MVTHWQCASLLLTVWAAGHVSCEPLIGHSPNSLDFIPLPRRSEAREPFLLAEPLPLFPLSAGGAGDGRNRADAGHMPPGPGPAITLAGHPPHDASTDGLSANNLLVPQSSHHHHELLPLFPLAPGGARVDRQRAWSTIAEEDDVPNSPLSPVAPAEQHHPDQHSHSAHNQQQPAAEEPRPDAPIAPGEGASSRKRARVEILSEQDRVPTRPRPSSPNDDDDDDDRYHHHLPAEDREQLAPDVASLSLPNLATRLDQENPEEPGPVYRNELQTAAAMAITPSPRSGSTPKTRREQVEFWNELSKQTREWTPPPGIDAEAKMTAYFMATHFQRALSNFPGSDVLEHLHNSNKILIPFACRLLMKPLSFESWARILLVWRNLWHEEMSEMATEPRRPSVGQVLRKFLWISNFICESTFPELFMVKSKTRRPKKVILTRPESRILNVLSDGSKHVDAIMADNRRQADMEYLRKLLVDECFEGDRHSAGAASWESDPSVWKGALAELNTQAIPITPKSKDIKRVEKRDLTLYLFGPRSCWNKIAQQAHGLVPARPCRYLRNYPRRLKSEIVSLFRWTTFDHEADLQLRALPLPTSPLQPVMRALDARLRNERIAGSTHTPPSFWPNRLHLWLHEQLTLMLRNEEAENWGNEPT
ncbi:hypothetical protein PTTG_06439 [Puccinia triticina 1-1 BBBD Race 1]|uniref:Uncharacterized protein n=1 Tax=Puccinia triticina (isolate 1-1 / race 1 (BBBD)) TaxID=630390 RepID=A0A180GW44_PUCT1|nr:hypothetical protein PTTG_06439 [Puccinia triticina 1-1 BBBD Race 1]